MSEQDFIRLLERYRSGQCTDEEIRLIDQWYDQLDGDTRLAMIESERLAMKKKLWQQINSEVEPETETDSVAAGKRIRFPAVRRWMAAAAVSIILGVGTFVAYQRLQPRSAASRTADGKVANTALVERVNTTDKPQAITLTDGSVVQLQPHSSIRYATNRKSPKREVWLTGKAFFQVQRNPSRPFLVYSGKVATRVLGTSFWVTAAIDAQTVEVSVQTGKVAVFKNVTAANNLDKKTNEEAEAVITPNQKVTIFVEQNRVTRGLIDEPKPIPSPEQSVSFDFDASPLSEVLSRLEQMYGIEMVVNNKSLADCRFTGNITQQPLYSKLELICQAINARYEIQGPRILINGPGCTP